MGLADCTRLVAEGLGAELPVEGATQVPTGKEHEFLVSAAVRRRGASDAAYAILICADEGPPMKCLTSRLIFAPPRGFGRWLGGWPRSRRATLMGGLHVATVA